MKNKECVRCEYVLDCKGKDSKVTLCVKFKERQHGQVRKGSK